MLQVLIHLQDRVHVELAGAGHQIYVRDSLFLDQPVRDLSKVGGLHLEVKKDGDVPSHLFRV